MKRLGIHGRLIIAVVGLIALATLALNYVGVGITRRFIQERFENRMFFLVRYLALNAELGILFSDRDMLKGQADNLLLEPDVVGVTIKDANGRELVAVARQFSGSVSKVEENVYLKSSAEESEAFRLDGKAGPQKEILGRVTIAYDTGAIEFFLTEMRNRFVMMSLAVAGLAVAVFFFISRSIVAPVRSLVDLTTEVSRGNMLARARPGSLPETRQLAVAFNSMLMSLEEHRRALEKANLEIVRTSTLAEVGKFSMMVAHEVKNPLGIIKSSVDILKHGISDESDKTIVSYIEDEIKRLNRLIEDFLCFAKPTHPKRSIINLNSLAEEVAVRYSLEEGASGGRFIVSIPSEACFSLADPDFLTRAFGNLIKNALEATENMSSIRIEAGKKEETWVLRVEDDGPGIAPEVIERIFEPFFTTRAKGTGLGLAYSLQVVKAHGGSIEAENKSPRGARFTIRLPIEGEEETADRS
ncbi:MAG: two-component sensor histidine kinase [Deltaproteobacteria bacterium CG_4_8_14_3_um_filter_51_11]|nr:MAG: two-component sensor histidine kinase [Deltaproteobacteria bacterium CG23_combo_of_CG06-09_8_20_14_all_51_20]PIX19048.1 MAG: two-component sensor histidine kinase [Deltaproteobacteria bacterium CG_4_8_14_3_um_filter_51_11]PJB33815.1 MAG: two-component sensor histidine kinase [Deltaproteobacteria bacterium CG_4_9_14_3_um_filter_51_14]